MTIMEKKVLEDLKFKIQKALRDSETNIRYKTVDYYVREFYTLVQCIDFDLNKRTQV